MSKIACAQDPIKPKKPRRRCRPRRKQIYRIANWPAYNTGLKARGRLGFWIAPEVLTGWYYDGPRQRGGAYQYSDRAIETGLILRLVYHLPWRQTEGFLDSILTYMGVSLVVPDYTTLARRSACLTSGLETTVGLHPLHVVVDSTGLKVYGEGEWKVRQHGYSKRRTWLKLHVARCDGDGAYDRWKVHRVLAYPGQGIEPIDAVVPPQRNASERKAKRHYRHIQARNERVQAIQLQGRKRWKQQTGYHRRSLAETGVERYKRIIGPKLRARVFLRQQVEACLGCKILNRMTHLGMPKAYKVEMDA
jgi:hypothetical protein